MEIEKNYDRKSKVVAHISFGGVGGQPMACLNLALEGIKDSKQIIAWYGNEEVAEQYLHLCENHGIPYAIFHKSPGLDLGTQLQIKSWFENYKPDYVFCHAPAWVFCGLVYRGLSRKVSVLVVEHHSNALKGAKEWVLSGLIPFLVNRVIYLSDEYRHQVTAKIPYIRWFRNTSVIPNGLAVGKIPYPPTPVAGTIGMQGRMFEGKDYETLFRSFARLGPELRLIIVGDGPDRPLLEKLSVELDIDSRVKFLGSLKHSELMDAMRTWDVFVHSTDGETMSVAIMEAQTLGLPIVASRVSGVTSAIRDNFNGLLFEPRDVNSLTEKLRNVLYDERVRENLSNNARKHALAHFSIEQVWEKYKNIMGLDVEV